MSGAIRKTIALTVARLKVYIKDSDDLRQKDNLTDDEHDQLQRNCKMLRRTLTSIEKTVDKWLDFIATLNGQEKTTELEQFENYKVSERQFQEWIELAKETCDLIEVEYESLAAFSRASLNSNITQHNSHLAHQQKETKAQHINLDRVRLPKFELPVFHGEKLKWPAFWQSFESAIHEQPIPAIQKLTYLRSCLRDSAFSCIEAYAVTNANYQVVVDVLTHRFGDTRAIKKRSNQS